MGDRIQRHERILRYIQHRERVLDMQSVVKTQMIRSKSMPPERKRIKQVNHIFKKRLRLNVFHTTFRVKIGIFSFFFS
uniref:Uncharacterized protein n=1 Tax=Heterorhabditis bacteriophora TaxID=37862 RepID=A0A1I7WS37_HETBA